MGRANKVQQLDPAIRDQIGRLFERGRTLDEIMEALRPLEVDVSRSGLHRYLKTQARMGERLRRSRAVAEVLTRQAGDSAPSRMAAANIDLVHSFLFDLMEKAEEAEEDGEAADGQRSLQMDTKELHAVAKSLDHLASASKKNLDFIKEAEERAAKLMQKQAVAAAETVAKQQGLSAETLAAIRAGILGVKA